MKPSHELWLKRLFTSLEIPAPDPSRLRRRIAVMERNIMLPVKAVFIGMISYSFNYSSHWIGQISSTPDVTVDTAQYIFSFYIPANCIFALFLLGAERLPLAVVQLTVVTSSLVVRLWV